MRRAWLGALLGVFVFGARAGAQQARCDFVNTGPSGTTHSQGYKLPSGEFNYFMGGGVLVRCPTKGIVIRADSLEYYGDERRIFLVRNVSYTEPRFSLTSVYLTYYLPQERIVATQDVHAQMPTGSTLDGPYVELLRAAPKIRDRQQVFALQRPTTRLVQKDSTGKPQPPMVVVANQLTMDGDSLVFAGGRVNITRDSLVARGDSAAVDTGNETMRLMRGPVIEAKQDRPYRLAGTLIDMYAHDRKIQRVVARGQGSATSKDLILRADTIDLRVNDNLLERAIAWGPGRAHAISPEQALTADSIDVRLPGQRVREVHALRDAFAQGHPDSTRYRADTTDWIRGDTIVALFDSAAAAPKDTGGPQIRFITAEGKASSYYHVAPSDTTQRRFAISYAKGRRITVDFDNRKVNAVRVSGQASGIYAEPGDTTKAAPARSSRNGARSGAPAVPGPPGTRPPIRSTPGTDRPPANAPRTTP